MKKSNFKSADNGKGRNQSYNKSKSKGKDYEEKKYERGDNKSRCKFIDASHYTTNDIAYYNKFPNDLANASRVYFNKTMGAPLDMGRYFGGVEYDPISNAANSSLPGIMVLRYCYGPGYASSFDDAVNRTFTQLMNDLYAKTASSELPFTKASVAMLFTSIASIANNIELVRKRMLTAKLWATRNINYPKALLAAMGTNLDSEITNWNRNMTEFNSLVRMFNKLEVPGFLDVYKRQLGLCGNIWTDEDDIFSQVYMFEPTGYYVYSDTENKAIWRKFGHDAYTQLSRGSSELLQIIKQQLGRWYTSQDLNLIRSSFYRAFGQYDAIQLNELHQDDMITFKGDQVIMDQIMNCDIVNGVADLDITEDVVADEIKWQPTVSTENRSLIQALYQTADTKMIRLFKADPTPDDITEATRLKVVAGIGEADTIPLLPNPEIVERVEIWFNSPNEDNELIAQNDTLYSNVYSSVSAMSAPAAAALLTTFRYIPTFILIQVNQQDDPSEPVLIRASTLLGDVYNYSDISTSQLENLNRVCALSLYKYGLTVKG